MKEKYYGYYILIGIGILLIVIYLLGQTMAIVNYDLAVSMGLQEPSSDVTEIGVALNKGFGFGDTVVYIPVFIVGIIGLIKKRLWGLYFMFAAMAITVYWPAVCLSTIFYASDASGWNFTSYSEYTMLLSAIALYGIWGFWYLYTYRNKII